jgi:hypothetical protein
VQEREMRTSWMTPLQVKLGSTSRPMPRSPGTAGAVGGVIVASLTSLPSTYMRSRAGSICAAK